LLFLDDFNLQGPVQYCQGFSSSRETIAAEGTSNNVSFTQLSINQQKPG